MTRKLLKIGEETSTGHIVESILGQGPDGAVYTSKNKEIRWVYYGNGLPERLGLVVARFDSLLADIKLLENAAEKQALYELAGKSLYLAFESSNSPDPTDVFADVERRLRGDPKTKSVAHANKAADLIIVCALHDPELQAVLSIAQSLEEPHFDSDPQTYHSAEWTTAKGRKLRVVLAAPNQMGLTASGILAAKMVLKFQPKLVVMAGIAAGAKSESQGFGDIVTPEHTLDFGAGKSIDVRKKVEVLPSPQPLSINAKLLGRLKEWQRARQGLDVIVAGWQAAKPNSTLAIHTGPMFSAPTVQATTKGIEKVLSQWRKLAAVEMEAYAVHRACNDTVDPPPLFLCAKSICDFAKGKNDDWQHYAAYTSSRFVHSFVTSEWERLVPA